MYESLQCVENIIPSLELPTFQNQGVQAALLNKKMLLAFDTGTGKTFTYAVFVRGLLNRDPEKKHIFVIIHDSLEQAPRDLRMLCGVPTAAFSTEMSSLQRLPTLWRSSSIIVLTYECFRVPEVVMFLYDHLMEIESVVIDEAHHAANWDVSDTAFMLRAITKFIPYVCELSATPATRESRQYYRLLNIIDRSLSPRRDETVSGKYDARYFPVNRTDYDIKGTYTPILKLVTPHPHQIGKIHGAISRVTKGTGSVNQVTALMEMTEDYLRRGKRVIIYVHFHDSRQWVEEHLQAHNIGFVSLHGKITNMKERQEVLDTYGSGAVNVLVTSVSESLNIDSDVVIFYEFTTKLKQVMGRAHRGLEGKNLDLVFIITKDSAEVDYFMKYVYERSITIQRLLRKDYSEFITIGKQLEELQKMDL